MQAFTTNRVSFEEPITLDQHLLVAPLKTHYKVPVIGKNLPYVSVPRGGNSDMSCHMASILNWFKLVPDIFKMC